MNDPSRYHPGLTADRLKVLAGVLVRVRRAALTLHDSEAGERNLSLGTRTFERACEEYRRLSKEIDWLSFYSSGNYFLLLVDGLPLKFHRTDPDDPAPRTTRELHAESAFKQKTFAFMETMEERRETADKLGYNWRLYFQDDPETKELFRVALARVGHDGKTAQSWDIDIGDVVTPITALGGDLPEAAELEQPEVTPKAAPARKTNDAG